MTPRLADPVAESTNTSWLQTLASGGRTISGGQDGGGSLCLHSSVCTTTLATPEPNTYIAGSAVAADRARARTPQRHLHDDCPLAPASWRKSLGGGCLLSTRYKSSSAISLSLSLSSTTISPPARSSADSLFRVQGVPSCRSCSDQQICLSRQGPCGPKPSDVPFPAAGALKLIAVPSQPQARKGKSRPAS